MPLPLFRPVPIPTLVWLRVAMGLLGGGDILGNGIYYHWYLDDFAGYTFRYYGFEWVHPLPEPLLSLYFIVGFLLGLAVALGWRFRITAPLFALFFSYLFLLEKAHYLNHAYLFTWLAWLLALTPAWREFSLDVRRNPGERRTEVPAWTVFLFPTLMGVVYFFGGIAKINADWLLEASPLHAWLQRRADIPLLGPLFALKPTAYVMAWGGMLLDLTAAFLLLHRRLRWVALGFLVFFHATNHLIFQIGIFPYLSMVLTSLFFAPDWPRRAIHRFAGFGIPAEKLGWARTQVRRWVVQWQGRVGRAPESPASQASSIWQGHPRYRPLVTAGLALIIGLHLFLPLRHWLFPSDVNWTEEGHRYSWRMMLRSKQGHGHYLLVDRTTGAEEIVQPRDSLTTKQYRKMTTHPDMILQYAHHLRDLRAAAGQDLAIYPRFRVSLNGGPRHTFLDRAADLSTIHWQWWGAKDWVLPEGETAQD